MRRYKRAARTAIVVAGALSLLMVYPGVSTGNSAPDSVDAALRLSRERVVANLVRNAETHGRGLAGLRAVVDGDCVRLEVEDRGAGVPLEDRERIFERFYRRSAEAGDRRRGDGVGLGLFLVAQHVRLHDGRVWVEDADPVGARFVVEIPIAGRVL